MKRRLLNVLSMICIIFTAVSCSSDDELSSNSSQHQIPIITKCTIGDISDNNTRATIDELSPVWEENDTICERVDKIGYYNYFNLKLTSGAGTKSGIFRGYATETTEEIVGPFISMTCYYPWSLVKDGKVNLTVQDGSNTKEMIMCNYCDYSSSFTFKNKTSILKLNIPVPDNLGWTCKTTGLTAIIKGAYSKGTLDYTSSWSNLSDDDDIEVSNIKVSSNGHLNGYVVVIPGSKVSDLKITITDGLYSFTTNAYTNSTAVIPENSVVTINKELLINKNYYNYTLSNYYQWDAAGPVQSSNKNYGAGSSAQTELFKSCPTAQQMVAYLKAGVYWDDNTKVTEGQQTYSAPSTDDKGVKTNLHTGLWVKKRAKIQDFDSEIELTYNSDGTGTFHKLSNETDDEVKRIRTSGEYFFLPAAGYYFIGDFSGAGSNGYYWSSTPVGDDSAYYLFFSDGYAIVYYDDRGFGYLPMVAE